MNKQLTFILILFFLYPAKIFPQAGETLLFDLVTPTLEFAPGEIHSIVFRINNNTNQTINFQPYLSLPSGLKLISELRSRQINANEQSILILSFNIPSKYKAGEYDFSINLVNPVNPSQIYSSKKISLTVKEVTGLEIELVEAPEFIRAGETINASYIIRNTGNTTQDIVINAFNCSVVGSNRISLSSGSSSIIKVTSQTDINQAYSSRKSFYIEAKSGNNVTELKYGFVRVMPSQDQENDLFHRFPISLTSRYLAKGRDGNFTGGYQIEVAGSGSIDPEGNHKVDFIARGPNQFDLSLLGLYDEYYLSYSNKTFSVFLGDKSYSMTPLTEYARYGRGAEQKINITKYSQVGLMYLKPRFYKNFKSEYGGYATVNFLKENSLGVYFLQKTFNDNQPDINLYSTTLNLQPFEKTSVEFEVSQSRQNNISDNAFRFNLNSQFSRFSLSSFFFHAGENYQGYYNNSNFYSGYANYHVNKWLSVGVSGRQDFLNAKQDTLYLTAPFSRQYQGLVNIKIGRQIFLKTYFRKQERRDRSPLEKFHYKTNSLNGMFSHRMKNFGYSFEGEFGETKNFLLPENENIKNTFRVSGNLNFQPSYKYYIQGFVTYTNINSFISDQRDSWIFGLSANGNISKNLRANLQLQNTYSIEEYYRNRNLLQFNFEYHFLKRHMLSATSFYTIFQNEVEKPDYSFSLNYTLNIGIPMKQIAEAGSISGKIENTGSGIVKGIILYTGGKTAITDENGVFSFKNLIPGNYTIMIDRSTIDFQDIPDVPTPIEYTVYGNQDTYINFSITKAVRISGFFELDEQSETTTTDSDELFIAGHVVVELRRENESIRIISDNKGNFIFPLVKPGNWHLKIYSNGIDNQYTLEKDYYELDLEPGEELSLKIPVRKKKRNIIFINNNVNLSSGNE